MKIQAVSDDCGINCPSSSSSLIDDIVLDLEEFKARKKEKDEQKRRIEQARQSIWETGDGHEALSSPQQAHLRFLRQDFYRKLAAVIEELTVDTLAAVLEAERRLQIWRCSMEAPSQSRYVLKACLPSKDAPMPATFKVRIEDRQATLPVPLSKRPNGRLIRRKLWEQRSDNIFLAQLKTVSAKQITEGRKTALEEAFEKEKLTDLEFNRLWLELQKPPRQLDWRYFYAGGMGFCEFSRTRAVQSKPKSDSKKKKGKENKGQQRGK